MRLTSQSYLLWSYRKRSAPPLQKVAQMMKFEEEEFICVDEEQERKREEELNGNTAVYIIAHTNML